MDIRTAFPSKWLRAVDLDGKDHTLTIERVTVEDLGGNGDPEDERPVLHFREPSKPLGLNRTNGNLIADRLGFETDNWIGNKIVAFATKTEYRGRQVDCIRIRPEAPAGGPAAT